MEFALSLSRKNGSLPAFQKEKPRSMAPTELWKLEGELRAPLGPKELKTQSAWQKTPARKPGTYAEKYLSDYKSRWMMRKNSSAGTKQVIQSVMSRHQDYPTFQKEHFPSKTT